MTEIFPTTFLDYSLLLIGSFAAASALSAVLPLRWGWKAFPLVLLGLVFVAAAIAVAVASICREKGMAAGAELSSGLFLALLMTTALAFGIIRAVRLRRGNRGEPRP